MAKKYSSGVVIIIALIAAFIVGGGMYYYATHSIPDYDSAPGTLMEEIEKAYPAYVSLKNHEPAVYAKVKNAVDAAEASKKTPVEINFLIQSILTDFAKNKLFYLPDALIIRSFKADIATAKALQPAAPEKCVSIISGQPVMNPYGSVKKELLQEEMAVLDEVIQATPITHPLIATQEDARSVFIPIFQKETAAMNIPPKDILAIYNGEKDAVITCAFMIAVSDDLVALPPQTAAAVMRFGLTKGKK